MYLPHLTRRQLLGALVVSLTTVIILSVAYVQTIFSTATVRSSAAGMRWVVVEKVRANFGFGKGYIPDNERPEAGDEIPPWDQKNHSGWDREGSNTTDGTSWDWDFIKSKWDSLFSQVHLLPSSPFGTFSSHASNQRERVTDWDDLPFENKAFKEWEYSRGMLYSGTGARMQRFLEKARSGRGFVVGVVGGSVSKGRGLPAIPYHEQEGGYVISANSSRIPPAATGEAIHLSTQAPKESQTPGEAGKRVKRLLTSEFNVNPDPTVSQNLYNPLNLHSQIFDFLNTTFPSNSSTPNRFVNGAQGGLGSDYFAGCWKEHLGEDVDLVLVELGINDQREIDAMRYYELLIRGLLEMPSKPAVMNVQTFTLLFSTLSQASSVHIDVAAYYDTPVISLRDVLLPRILNDPTAIQAPGGVLGPGGKKEHKVGLEVKKWFRNVPEAEAIAGDAKVVDGVDLMHISHHAHTLLAQLVIHYLQLQIADMEDYDLYLDEEEDSDEMDGLELTDIPGMLLASAYTPHARVRKSFPVCRTANSGFESRRLTLPEHHTKGWETYNWGEKRYLIAKKPGERISFPFEVKAKPIIIPGESPQGEGWVKIGHLRSNVLHLGSVDCWVGREGESEKTRIDGWWETKERNMGVISDVRHNLLPGHHTLTCEVSKDTLDPEGGHEFRLISVVYD